MISKLKQFWLWLKRQWKKIAVIIIGGSIIVYAAGLPPEVPCKDFNGTEICFPYTDDLTGEDLIFRTDKQTYGGWTYADLYVMVENIGKAQNYDISWLFTDENEFIESVAVMVENVPYQVEVFDYATSTYGCGEYNTSTGRWGDECIEKTITGSHQEQRYRDEWQPLTLEDFTKQTQGKKAKKKITTHINKNAIYYLKVRINFPRQSEGEFYLLAEGDKGGAGFLDPNWYSAWLYRKEITIDPAKVDLDLANFPVYVDASTSVPHAKVRADYYDVVFTQSNGDTLIDFEREATSTFWVEVPTVSSSTAASTTFYMYYGNASAGDISSTTAPWDSSFTIVYHLADDDADTTIVDSVETSNGSKKGNAEPSQIDAKIYKGQDFDGTDDYITSNYNTNNLNEPTTFEFWVEPDATGRGTIFTGYNIGDSQRWDCEFDGGGNQKVGWHDQGASYYSSGTLTVDSMNYVTVIHEHPGLLTYYIDGSFDSTSTTAYALTSNINLSLGNRTSGSTFPLDVIIDEFRISDAERSAAWIKASYNSGNDSLLSYGSEEESPSIAVEERVEVNVMQEQ